MLVACQLQAELQEVASRVQSVRLLQQLKHQHVSEDDVDLEGASPGESFRGKSLTSMSLYPGGLRSPSSLSSPNASAGSKAWSDFRSFWSASSTLYGSGNTKLDDSWWQKIKFQAKGIWMVVLKNPWVVLVPLIVLCISVGVGVWAVLAASDQQTQTYKSDCSNAVQSTINSITSAISQALAPSSLLRNFVSEFPEWNALSAKFPSLAKKLLAYDGARDTQSLELLPFGVYTIIYPPTFVSLPVGTDLFYAKPGDYVQQSIRAGMVGMLYQPDFVLLSGPYHGDNTSTIRAISSVFVSGVSPNETFNNPTNGTTGCATFPCYNPYGRTPTKYWGAVSSVISVYGLKQTYNWDALDYTLGYDFNISRYDIYSKQQYNIALSRWRPKDPLVFTIPISNGNWTLKVSRHAGWEPAWKWGLVAAVVLLCIILSTLLFFLMVKQSQHSALLMSMVPSKVVRYLEAGRTYAESFDNVSIIFTDIVSYTKMSSMMTAEEVASLLNEIYGLYDELCAQHGMRRVDIIGDSYMAVAGAPEEEDRVASAVKAVRFAQAMIAITQAYVTTLGLRIQIRVGINSGPVVATVIGGSLNPKFTLLGDAVNTASRMESNSLPMKIHVSQMTADLITLAGLDLQLNDRGAMEIKGKGTMNTYFVEGANYHETAKSFTKAYSSTRFQIQDPEVLEVGK
jgi:class 3 adenylate cyclase